MKESSVNILFQLLRSALGSQSVEGLPADIDWQEVVDLSFEQGVAAIAVDGLQECLPLTPPEGKGTQGGESLELALDSPELEDLKYEWFWEVFSCEEEFHTRDGASRKLASMWAAEGISTVILKGASFAQYYPIAGHRYSCDLDLFIGEDWKRGCSVLERKGFDICYEVYKDAQFHIDGVYVECHRYLMSIRGNRTLQRFERYLRSLLKDKAPFGDDSLFAPPLMFNALFCIEHARGHLLHGPLTLRQVCDWMMIRRQPVDWDEFWKRCEEFGFTRFAHLMEALADLVEGKVTYGELASVDRKVVDEMLMAGSASQEADGSRKISSFFQRRVRQFFTILGNGWKYREFNDVSMPVALFRQVWTHFFRKKVEL